MGHSNVDCRIGSLIVIQFCIVQGYPASDVALISEAGPAFSSSENKWKHRPLSPSASKTSGPTQHIDSSRADSIPAIREPFPLGVSDFKLANPKADIVLFTVGFLLLTLSLRPVPGYGVNGYLISISVSMIGQCWCDDAI
jgi:hypothetical protein